MGITLTQSSLVIPTCLSPCSKRAIFCLTPDSPTIPSSFSSKPHSLTHRFPYWPLRWSPRCGTPKALYSQTFHSYSITKPFHSYPGQKEGCRPTVWFWSFGKLFSVCRWVYAFWNVCKLHCKPVIWDRNGSVSVECMNNGGPWSFYFDWSSLSVWVFCVWCLLVLFSFCCKLPATGTNAPYCSFFDNQSSEFISEISGHWIQFMKDKILKRMIA